MEYDFRKIERKWQDLWAKQGLATNINQLATDDQVRAQIAQDIIARYKKSKGIKDIELTPNPENLKQSDDLPLDINTLINTFGVDALRFVSIDRSSKITHNDVLKYANTNLGVLWQLVDSFIATNPNPSFILSKNDKKFLSEIHKTIRDVSALMKKNEIDKAIERIGILTNYYKTIDANTVNYESIDFMLISIIQMLHPVCPFITSELWERLGFRENITWPKYDTDFILPETVKMSIMVNGKQKTMIAMKVDYTESELNAAILADPKIISTDLKPENIKKIVYVKNKLVNIITNKKK
jgi:leucyl-tRNA synthetase